MKIPELIEILKKKEQSDDVEYIVVKLTGELVSTKVSTQAKAMIKFLKLFG